MKNTLKIGIYNHKGGVGKTTSAINIAYNLHKMGKKILVCDCDSQRNCYSFFGETTKYENIFSTVWSDYKNAENTDCDCVILDLPPAMTDEVKEIIRLCDAVYVPIILGDFEISGLADVTNEIHRQGTALGGVFVTIYQAKNDFEILQKFRKIMDGSLMSTIIPSSQTVRESQKMKLSIEEYFDFRKTPNVKSSRQIAIAYKNLTDEILRRCA